MAEAYTVKADVWSFAIVVWEIFSFGIQPYNWMNNAEVADTVSKEGCVLKPPEKCPEAIWELMKECWSLDPIERPSFKKVIRAAISLH